MNGTIYEIVRGLDLPIADKGKEDTYVVLGTDANDEPLWARVGGGKAVYLAMVDTHGDVLNDALLQGTDYVLTHTAQTIINTWAAIVQGKD